MKSIFDKKCATTGNFVSFTCFVYKMAPNYAECLSRPYRATGMIRNFCSNEVYALLDNWPVHVLGTDCAYRFCTRFLVRNEGMWRIRTGKMMGRSYHIGKMIPACDFSPIGCKWLHDDRTPRKGSIQVRSQTVAWNLIFLSYMKNSQCWQCMVNYSALHKCNHILCEGETEKLDESPLWWRMTAYSTLNWGNSALSKGETTQHQKKLCLTQAEKHISINGYTGLTRYWQICNHTLFTACYAKINLTPMRHLATETTSPCVTLKTANVDGGARDRAPVPLTSITECSQVCRTPRAWSTARMGVCRPKDVPRCRELLYTT